MIIEHIRNSMKNNDGKYNNNVKGLFTKSHISYPFWHELYHSIGSRID